MALTSLTACINMRAPYNRGEQCQNRDSKVSRLNNTVSSIKKVRSSGGLTCQTLSVPCLYQNLQTTTVL